MLGSILLYCILLCKLNMGVDNISVNLTVQHKAFFSSKMACVS